MKVPPGQSWRCIFAWLVPPICRWFPANHEGMNFRVEHPPRDAQWSNTVLQNVGFSQISNPKLDGYPHTGSPNQWGTILG